MRAELHLDAVQQHSQRDTTLVGVTLNLISRSRLWLASGQQDVVP
jgi:hypothetical protein